MGNNVTPFTKEQLDAYQDCTFFTKREILRIFKRFQELSPNTIPAIMTDIKATQIKIPYVEIEVMPELRENPFCERICQAFSEDRSGDLTFDEFLDMFSVFSAATPQSFKCAYAFKIYDFDGDNFLSTMDIEKTIKCLTRNELTDEEVSFIVGKVMQEAAINDDNLLSYIAFESIVCRSPDFLNTFHIRI